MSDLDTLIWGPFISFELTYYGFANAVSASLGQVYKGRLKENGDPVAVKVQRPFVLETVTVDLYIIRNLGLVLRRFPQVLFLKFGSYIRWWWLNWFFLVLTFKFLIISSVSTANLGLGSSIMLGLNIELSCFEKLLFIYLLLE